VKEKYYWEGDKSNLFAKPIHQMPTDKKEIQLVKNHLIPYHSGIITMVKLNK
jgi:hypothetical protein